MVQFSTFVVAAAFAASALAAPLDLSSGSSGIEARAIKAGQVKNIGHNAHKAAHAAKSTIETAAAINSLVGPRDLELDSREPRFSPATLAKLRALAHKAHLAAHGFKSTAETGAAINSMIPQHRREVDSDIESREPLSAVARASLRNAGHLGHQFSHGIKGLIETAATIKSMIPQKRRELDFEDFEAREPRFSPATLAKLRALAHKAHLAAHGFKSTAETGAAVNSMIPQNRREVDYDIESREPLSAVARASLRNAAHLGHQASHGIKGLIETAATIKSMIPQNRRELDFEDFEAREPRFSPATLAKLRALAHKAHLAAHAFKSTAGTAATINSMIPQKRSESIDARELSLAYDARELEDDFEEDIARDLGEEYFDDLD